ncbi:polymorphic toxin type 23 domain-containing protein [Capnocytophaga ochracea]|uniref:Cell wall-associated polypeptide CWBP200 n=2 Tax=Capnocytophaga TaxID=1016 RepID=A0A2X2T086_CAPOC|nr:polymorphic toxin type 23 domain-containing protein [Capnocytophaga ochracea]SQA93853.1 Cell wall-associated polypeptide CWBP200 [Capnocytophaga ochracea]
MKRLLLLLSVCYTLGSVAQESYPLQAIERTSFYAEPVDPPTETALPSGNIAARDGGGNTVGLTTGELSVSGTGAAVYTVPIAVPQGIKGVAPTLALTYNSQSGNGIAGYGWHLAGLSVISRVGSTMYHNGKITEVNLTETDQFALDGQRLMLKEGKHGESGAVYETETFSQVRIKAVGKSKNAAFGPDYFEVLYPDGSKAYYGSNFKANNSQSLLEYALSHWENAQGISIEYFYTIENNRLYIKRIEYERQAIEFFYKGRQRPELAYIGGFNFFNDSLLSEIIVNNNGNIYRKYTLNYDTNSLEYDRLKEVKESVEGSEHTPIVFNYTDTPKDFNPKPFECETNLGMIRDNSWVTVPMDFNGDSYTDFVTYRTTGDGAYKKLFFFENFRNTQTELVTEFSVSEFKEILPMQILAEDGSLNNGQSIVTIEEGKEDFYFRVYTKKDKELKFEYGKSWSYPAYPNEEAHCRGFLSNVRPVPPITYDLYNKNIKFLSGDFYGDGHNFVIAIERPIKICESHMKRLIEQKETICTCEYKEVGDGVYWIALERERGFVHSGKIGNIRGWLRNEDLIFGMDVNGNGKTDIVHITKGSLYVYELNNGLDLIYEHHSNHIFTDDQHPIAGDFNGDGKIDFLLPIADGNSSFEVLYNRGTKKPFGSIEKDLGINFKKSKWKDYGNNITSKNIYSYIPIDINNDGKTDIIEYYTLIVSRKQGDSYEEDRFVDLHINQQLGRYFYFKKENKRVMLEPRSLRHVIYSMPDQRDRVVDISFFSGDRIENFSLQKNNKEDMLLRGVSNGRIDYTIEYVPMMEKSHSNATYKKTTHPEKYPYVSIGSMPSVRLVSSLERKGENMGSAYRLFKYYNAVTHTEGLGFLGFSVTKSTGWVLGSSEKPYLHKVMNPRLRGAVVKEYLLKTSDFIAERTTDIVKEEDIVKYTSYIYNDNDGKYSKIFKLQLTQQTTEDKLSGLTTTNNFSYDADGNLTEQRTQTDGYSQSTRVSYLPKSESPYFSGLPQQKETTTTLAGDSFSTAETFAYEKGLLTTHKTKGNGTGWRTTSYGYDEYGNVTEQTATAEDGQQRTERYTYDPSHRFVTAHTDHEGQVTKFSYNNRGLLESETTPLGQSTLYAYDLWGRPTQTTNFLGKKTTMRYSFDGGIFKNITENEEGAYSAESYNTLGWLLEKESNDAFNNHYAVSYEYDGIGQQVAVSTPHPTGGASQKAKRTEYDVYGRPTTITSPEGKITRFTYDKLKTTTDDGQQQVISIRDAQGNIVEHQDTGGTVRYTYFANGSLKTADYGGAIQKITQDGWGRKTSLTDPSAGRYTYQYDTWGNLTEETTPKGKTTFSYAQGSDRLTEKHITGDYTDMRIRYTYNADKLLTQIDNQNKDGNNDSYRYEYNGLKQLVQTTETNPQAVFTKNYTYDAFGRVQQETSTAQTAGKRVSSAVQYRYENGELIEMKTASGATLWKLNASNEYGQPLSLHKGKIQEHLQYNSHFPKTQTVQREDTPLNVLQYDFNTQRGLLNHRTYSFYNQKEEFAYDTTDRLTRWGNATHQYDERGRITENSAMGTYEYAQHSYQQQKLNTNEAGETYLEKHPIPTVRYNTFKAPEQIYVKDKERISYEYNAFGERSHCYYGNAEVEKAKRPMLKHYSHDGSVEIVCNKTDNSTKFILYLGGDAYSAPAILISDGETQKLYYLHRDYLGSIVMLTDENGNIAERRHFDPWGHSIKIEDGAGNTLDKLTLLDRGFTGHEHLQTVGLIHMNGRLYDPALHRFLQPDNYVQDPFNTQNFNRYGYCLNNPLLYTDPNGEFFWAAVIIGAIIGASSYAVSAAINDSWSWGSFGLSVLGGAVGGAVTGALGSTAVLTAESIANGIATGAASSMLPSVSFPIGDWNISLSMALALGNASGMGANFAVGYNDGNWGFSAGVGIMAYNNYYGFGKNALEYRRSAMISWDDGSTGVSLGTNAWSGDFSQRTGMIGFRSGDFKLMYENDGGAGIKHLGLGDRNDSYRTAALNIGIGDFTAGFNLFTGRRNREDQQKEIKITTSNKKSENPVINYVDRFGTKYKRGYVNEVGEKYRLGALTLGYGGFRIGANSEKVRHAIQDVVIHGLIKDCGFMNTSWQWGGFYQYRTYNPFTSW